MLLKHVCCWCPGNLVLVSAFLTVSALQARPIEEGLAEAIDEGRVGPRDDPKIRSKILSEEFGWDKDLAKKIWCFGPDTTGKPQSGCF